MVVDPQGQTHDQEGVSQRQVTHIHHHGAIGMASHEENKDAEGVAEEPKTANDAVADGQEERQDSILNLTGIIAGVSSQRHCACGAEPKIFNRI